LIHPIFKESVAKGVILFLCDGCLAEHKRGEKTEEDTTLQNEIRSGESHYRIPEKLPFSASLIGGIDGLKVKF